MNEYQRTFLSFFLSSLPSILTFGVSSETDLLLLLLLLLFIFLAFLLLLLHVRGIVVIIIIRRFGRLFLRFLRHFAH